MPFLKFLRLHWDKLFLLVVLSFLCLQNYTPGTYLTGWDNLIPELNIGLNLKRSLFAVWQEYQGLGLVGGMAHATDLIRQLILLPFTLILPHSLIRYLWHFSMLFLGTFGIYFGLKKTTKSSKLVLLASSLFYLLNFGTIQYFWNPLETFSNFWGFYPWLIFSLISYLQDPSKKNLRILLLLNLLAIPAFYVQTLFIVYLFSLTLIFLSQLLISPKAYFKAHLPKQLKVILLILALNSFWLLPQLYFLSGSLQNPTTGIGNFMSNDDTFARNLARGNPSDFLLLRGYYYDFPNNNSLLMASWQQHFSNQLFLIPGYLLSAIFLFGSLALLSKPKKLNLLKLSTLLILLLSATTLLSNLSPFAELNSLFRSLPLLNQIFRSPWTKFLVPASFSFTVLFTYGLNTLISTLSKLKYSKKVISTLLPTLSLILLLLFSYPVFQGSLISKNNRNVIPDDYQQLSTYLNTQNQSGRLMNLPQGSFWGWTNYRWGHTGSGFLWYLLPQPILDRAFDAWNLNNESYYWQLTTAIQEKDPLHLQEILEKYNVQYVLFDNYIYFPDDKVYSKNALPTLELLQQIPGLKLTQAFGQLSLFEYDKATSPYLLSNPSTLKPQAFTYHDSAYTLLGDYLNSDSSSNIFPFSNLFTNRLQEERAFQLKFDQPNLILSSQGQETSIPINYSVDQEVNISPLEYPYQNLVENQDQYFQLLDNSSQHSFVFNFPLAQLSESYLLRIEHRHSSGLNLEISIVSQDQKNKYLQTILPNSSDWTESWFIIPAREDYPFNSGLNIILTNKSLNSLTTQNHIKSATLYPFPYQDLIQQNNLEEPSYSTKEYLDSQNHLFFYKAQVPESNSNQYLVLPQSFDKGWLAFYIKDNKPIFLKQHQLANNWANSWNIDNLQNQTIYILFWPQLLQFLGFILIPTTLLLALKRQK